MKILKVSVQRSFFYVLFILLISFSVTAKDESKSLVIGIEALDYLPYYQVKAGEPLSGYGIDLLRLFASKSGYDIVFKAHTVSRLFSVFLAGRVDFKYPDSPNWSSQMKKSHGIIYSKSTTSIIDGILTLRENSDLLLDEFKVIGSIRGFSPWPYMSWVQTGKITLIEAEGMDQLFRLLKAGRIHGAYINVVVGTNYIKQHYQGLDVVWNHNLPFGKDNYFLSSIKHGDVIEEFDRFLITYKKDIDKLKGKYGIDNVAGEAN